ncbi:CPBP family intramembrane glutamic endopeptidase [Paenibacillus filicis]|uniref:CPBP family intramembrane glutamic endopeptidase n=1 Tax=Paenibacillus filicis TaxID=669464 RepID=A0ABU9DEG6_9BACL
MQIKHGINLKKQEMWILIIFFIGGIPGVSLDNKVSLTLIPLLGTASIIWLLKKEWLAYDFNLLKSGALYVWVGRGITYCILVQAFFTIIFGLESTSAEKTSFHYVIMPVYIVTGAILEEIVFRKILLKLSSYPPFWLNALISSSIYAAYHFTLSRFISFLAVGLILCVIYKKSGSIAAPIITHIVINILGLIAMTLRN